MARIWGARGSADSIWAARLASSPFATDDPPIGQRSGSTFLSGAARWTLGLPELAVGRPDAACEHLLALTDLQIPTVNPLVALPAIPHTIEAAVRAGRTGF